MALVDPFEDFKVPAELVLEFVAVFSRCEFAMKAGTYRRNANGMAAAAWDRLASEASDWLQIPGEGALTNAVKLLSGKPPQVEKYDQGWQDAPPSGHSDVERALKAAVQVRNNLFHGGKHHPSQAGRDAELVAAALLLLKATIEAEPGELRAIYNTGG